MVEFIPNFKLRVVALAVAGVVMMGFGRDANAQQGKKSLDFACTPVFNEAVEFHPIDKDIEDIDFYTKCTVTNRGPKKVFITKLDSYAQYGGIDKGKGVTTSLNWGVKFELGEDEIVYFYNLETKKLHPTALPIGIESDEPITFFTKTALTIGEKTIQRLNAACPDRLTKAITLYDLLNGCMGGEFRAGNILYGLLPNSMDILHTVTTEATLFTSTGLKIVAADTAYVVKSSGSGGGPGTVGPKRSPSK